MNRLKNFTLNALILGGVTILNRAIAVIFNAYVSNKIGAEGMGLYALTSSAYIFAVTLATSGINLAVTRLVSEELALENGKGAIGAMRRCLIYAAIFGSVSSLSLFFGARYIADELLGDGRTYLSLRFFALALPFIAISNVFAGYFNAVRRAYKSASSNVIEQFIKIAVTVALLGAMLPRGTEYACAALVGGTCISEGLSFVYLLIFYLIDKKKHIRPKNVSGSPALTRRMIGIAVPIALSSYLRSGLTTIEHVLIPRGMRKYGADLSTSLAAYGVVHGMALPIVLFPAAVSAVYATLIVPELSELAAQRDRIRGDVHISYIARRSVKFGLIFSLGTAAVMFAFAPYLGEVIYGNYETGKYIRILSLIIPVMYLDTIVDGMLKGLGEQLASMEYNIIDAAVSVVLVLIAVPELGIDGYVITIFVTEILNGALSLARLKKVVGFRVDLSECLIMPLICGAASSAAAYISGMFVNYDNGLILAGGIVIQSAMYLALLRLCGAVNSDDTKWLRSAVTVKSN